MKLRELTFHSILAIVVVFSASLYSCKDFTDADFESNSGEADFSTIAAAGNSLTAGFQSNALFETAQRYSYPALVAGQMEMVHDFEQPLISNPGIGGRLQLDGAIPPMDPANMPAPSEEEGTPINADLGRPYNNLGIPGAISADFLGRDLPGASYDARRQNNPFFDIVLGDSGNTTQAEQLAQLQPSFILFWQGNNDVLSYVTSGGTQDYIPPETFSQLYQACMQTLVQTEADAAIFNIPDVTSIPFVFYLRVRLQQQEALTFDQNAQAYQLVTPQGNFPVFIETAAGTRIMRQNDFLLLSASDYVAGVQSGEIPPPISPDNPVPNQLVLDGPAPSLPSGSSELAEARGAVQQYNNIIAAAAENNGYALVDIHSRFNEIIEQGGVVTSGDTLRPVPGELFSFDGVHPGNRGSGVIANHAIEAINNTFNANLPTIDLATIPPGIPVAN